MGVQGFSEKKKNEFKDNAVSGAIYAKTTLKPPCFTADGISLYFYSVILHVRKLFKMQN